MNQQKDNNSTQIWVAAVIIGVIGLLVYLLQDNSIHWNESYKQDATKANKNPFDLSVIRAILATPQTPVKDIESKLALSLPNEGTLENYLFIGEAMRLDSNDAQALRQFIERGNNAFISSKYISKRLIKHLILPKLDLNEVPLSEHTTSDTTQSETTLNEDNYTTYQEDSTVTLPLNNADASSKFNEYQSTEYQSIKDSNFVSRVYLPDTLIYETGYFNAMGAAHFASELYHFNHILEHKILKDAKALGDLQKKYSNFLVVPYGKGKLFIHSNPIFFTNVEMIEPEGKTHAEHVLAHLPEGKIYWDKFSQTDLNTARHLDSENTKENKANNNILKYVIGHRSLASAWYLLLGMGLLFVIFGAKRRQRIVPVLPSKTNTSLEYLQSLGRLFFRQGNHTGLTNMKFKHFLAFVRQRYGLGTNQLNDNFQLRLSQKSGVDTTIIKKIIESAQYAERLPIEEDFLITFHQHLELFYKNCK